MLFAKLKGLFARRELPDETRRIYETSSDLNQLLHGLDQSLTRNEVEMEKLKKETLQLEARQSEEQKKIQQGSLSPREERFALQTIKRLRNQLELLDRRLAIFDQNVQLNHNLLAKILDVQAMQLRGVEEDKIDDIVTEFEAHLETYLDSVRAGELTHNTDVSLVSKEDAQLASLKAEILGQTTANAEGVSPKAAVEKTRPVETVAASLSAPKTLAKEVKKQIDLEVES